MPKLSLCNLVEVIREESPARTYRQAGDSRRYPSITSVLSTQRNEALEAWKSAVGEEEAVAISRRAASRGTTLHESCEKFLLHGVEPSFTMFQQVEQQNYMKMRNVLLGMDEVFAVEAKLISHELQIGGTVDCITSIRGVPYIIDFKTASSYKSKEDIPNYFMQAAFYSQAWLEMTGQNIDRTLIAIACAETEEPLIYVSSRTKWIERLQSVRNSL